MLPFVLFFRASNSWRPGAGLAALVSQVLLIVQGDSHGRGAPVLRCCVVLIKAFEDVHEERPLLLEMETDVLRRTAPASILLRRSSWQVMSLWRSGRMSGGSTAILRLRGGFCGRPWLLVRRDEPIRVKRYAFPASSTDASRGAVLFELPASGHRDASASNALAGLYAHPPHRVTKSRISWRLAENRGLGHCHQDRRGGSSAR